MEVYGSSETAGLGWRSHYQEPFRLLPWWQLQQQPHEQGLSTTATCTRTGVTTVLQDKIECISDNLIRVHGRQDAVIQIAGHNINLDTLASALAQHPDVYAAKVSWHQQQGDTRLHYFLAVNFLATNALGTGALPGAERHLPGTPAHDNNRWLSDLLLFQHADGQIDMQCKRLEQQLVVHLGQQLNADTGTHS